MIRYSMMIECQESYQKLFTEIENHDLILHIVPSEVDAHASICEPIAAFLYDTVTNRSYTISLSHTDIDYTVSADDIKHRLNKQKNRIWALDKKSLIQTLPLNGIHDINLLRFLKNNPVFEDKQPTAAHNHIKRLHPNMNGLGRVIPLLKHKESFDSSVSQILETVKNAEIDDSYHKLNTVVIETLAQLESNGICVDQNLFTKHFDAAVYANDRVYSQYNIYTSTGRPSNRFDGVNYAALNKENGCRKCFVSRHGTDPKTSKQHGKMVLIDYAAFHPRIISHLIDFELPVNTDIYQYLGEIYFNKQNLTQLDIDEAKKLTFRQLYGGVEKQYEHIKYFNRLKGYVDDHWKHFQKYGYVETPFFRRKITSNHIQDPNPNKLFNYILQATETEIAIPVINDLNEFLRKRQSKAILYTYDSVLFDFCVHDPKDTLHGVLEIMRKNGKFPVRVYAGNNYNDLTQISVS